MAKPIITPYSVAVVPVESYMTFEGAFKRSKELSLKGQPNTIRKAVHPGTTHSIYQVIPVSK